MDNLSVRFTNSPVGKFLKIVLYILMMVALFPLELFLSVLFFNAAVLVSTAKSAWKEGKSL